MLHGVTSFHDEHTPIWGLSQSSSVMPMARSMARAGAREGPSVTSRLRGLIWTRRSLGVPSAMTGQRRPGAGGDGHAIPSLRRAAMRATEDRTPHTPPVLGPGRHPHDREIVRLAVPAFGALIAEPLYVLADTAIVGHIGTPQLGGLAVASSVLLTGYAVFIF